MFGGENCGRYAQPFQAIVFHQVTMLCGGVLVHPQWVLTAAHCMRVHYELCNVYLGLYSRYGNRHRVQSFEITGGFPHPEYNLSLPWILDELPKADLSNDLMLLRLNRRARMTRFVKALHLPISQPRMGSTCYTSGWDDVHEALRSQDILQDTLQCIKVTLVPNMHCSRAHSHKITDRMLCVRGKPKYGPACLSNLGGPLVCEGTFQGIGSGDSNMCDKGNLPGVFTKVVLYTKWINDTIMAET